MDDMSFEKAWQDGEFIETALVHGFRYGTPRDEIEIPLGQGSDVILKVDVQGAEQIRQVYPDALGIFMLPESIGQLRARLEERNAPDIETRLENAQWEMDQSESFDHRVTNLEDRLQDTVDTILAIIEMTKTRAAPNP